MCREKDVIVSLASTEKNKNQKNRYARTHTDGWRLVKIGHGWLKWLLEKCVGILCAKLTKRVLCAYLGSSSATDLMLDEQEVQASNASCV